MSAEPEPQRQEQEQEQPFASPYPLNGDAVPNFPSLGSNLDLEDELEDRLEREREEVPKPFDYYAVLNLDRNASEDEIKVSYRRLCVTFHPDKHLTPADKEAAQGRFQALQRAYDVLSDPVKRHIYDLYGLEGLSSSWDVSANRSNPNDIRAEFERMKKDRQSLDAENLVKSKGEIQVAFDATRLFDPYDRLPRRRRAAGRTIAGFALPPTTRGGWFSDGDYLRALPEMKQATIKHSWDTKISQQTDFGVQGTAIVRNGVGVANVMGTLRHVHSPLLWGELAASVGQASFLQAKVVKNFTGDSFVTVNATFATTSIPPPLVIVTGRRLTSMITGYLTYRTGEYSLGPWGASEQANESSACSIGLVRRNPESSQQMSLEVQAGLEESHIQVSFFRPFAKGRVRGRVSVGLSTGSGVTGAVAVDRRVSKHIRVGVGVDCGTVGGVTLKLRLTRLGQRFAVPVLLSPQLDVQVAIWATAVPLCISFAFDRLVVAPQRRNWLAKKLREVREQNAAILQQRKNEAEDAVRLMRESVARKFEAEESRNGLVIVEAIYGKIPPTRRNRASEYSFLPSFVLSGEENTSGESWIDVTIPVQALVNQSQLHISGGHSKAYIIGFYDPCLGENKRLLITYRFQGRLHEVEVDDTAAVAAPLRGHLI
ncbi:hypothetical protein BJ742DRAFT_856333 [Cladochytrium replicatum]|nr:hypothetical protein BJ742DRAFT_856333 [Cladochytrium replicatum]